MHQKKKQQRLISPILSQKSNDYSSDLVKKQLNFYSNFMNQPKASRFTSKNSNRQDSSNFISFEKQSEYKQNLRRVNSMKPNDFNSFKNLQRTPNKQQPQAAKRNNQSNKFKDIEHQKLNDKLYLIEQKVLEMKSQLLKKKQEKQRIIKQQAEERQRWHKQRHIKAQFDHQEKQKKRIPNITVEQRIKKLTKTPVKQFKSKLYQNYPPTPSILEEKQNSIIQDVVTQLPQPQNIHLLTQNPYSPRSNIYYVSEIMKTYQDSKSLSREHLIQSLQIMRTLQSSRMPTISEIERKKLNLLQRKQHTSKKTLIFDLDETLIHCNSSLTKTFDFKIGIKFQNGSIVEAGVNIRPYAKEILRNLHNQFEIVVFTASQSCYADEVLKILDPHKEYIIHRLYRQHCFLSQQGMYIKDLRIINREMSQIILVDNAAYSYYFQLQNGIPIVPYYQGSVDFELKELQKYLRRLNMQKDVRKLNRDTFKLHRYHEFYNTPNKLVEDLYINKL